MKIANRHLLSFIILSALAIAAVMPSVACLGAVDITSKMIAPLGSVNLPAGNEPKALTMVGQVIGIFLSLLGVIFLGLIIYGGFKWMTAQGREEDVTTAKTVIKNAIIGLVIVMAAYAISFFITSQLEKTIK